MLPQGNPSLDVRLHLGDAARLWHVGQSKRRPGFWHHERSGSPDAAYGELATLKEALDKRREFEQQIAVARGNGWS